MKLEEQVCSLELAKRLKELGVKQESLFRWTHALAWSKSTDGRKTPGRGKDYVEYGNAKAHKDFIAAFTVAELGEMLPRRLELGSEDHPAHRLVSEGLDTMWHATYVCATCHGKLHSEYDLTEADA